MRNKIAKKLRKEAGVQTSTSNRLEYEFLKKEHKYHTQNPVFKLSGRAERRKEINKKTWVTRSTLKLIPTYR